VTGGTYDYDLFVIGAGSGGVRAARIAARHGAKVAVAEESRYGGTCVIRGCVPKKLLVYASRFADDFKTAQGFGWTVPEPTFDWAKLIAAKDHEITRLEGLYRQTLNGAAVTTMDSRAVIEAPNRLYLSNLGKTVTAKTILVATGARPYRETNLAGLEHAITSDEAFDLKTLPRRIVIVGGGYIAVEFAGIFKGLGSDVTLVHRGDKVLRGFDEDLRDDLVMAMAKRGTTFKMTAKLVSIARDGDAYRVTLSTGEQIACDAVMLATGRVPNTAGLGLERAGVELGPKGEVLVDEQSRTTAKSIFAVGDVTDQVNLTPVAIRQGHAFADTVYGDEAWTCDLSVIPTGVFSTPEIGTVGLSEAVARATVGTVDIYKTRFRSMKVVLSGGEERTLMKLVVDGETDAVLGCHVLGPDAAEIIQMAAIALKMGATKADFDATMAVHPSAAEELVTLRTKWVAPAS
jgi:glutathione reductase (NADPH)